MNKIVNKFPLHGDKFMPKLNYNNHDLLVAILDRLLNILKEFKNLKKLVI